MNLVDEQHAWHNLGFALFPPLWYFLVDLLPHFLSDFSCSPWKQRQKPLWSRVDHIDFMQCHSVNHLFSLLNLTFRTIYESCLRAHCVVLWSPRKTSSRFRNLARSLIDCDHITCNDFLFLNGLNHLLTQIVNRLHLSRFKRNFTSFWSRSFYKKINYLKIFQFKFLQLLPLRFRFLPWFLHQLIF